MRIKNIHIDEFGEFAGRSYGPLERPMSIFYGSNEAGKTTLLAFIRHVLFGFPYGNARENRYMIQEAGRHGGNLQILTDNGDGYTVSRQRGRAASGVLTITTNSGTVLDEAELPRLLGQVSAALFKSAFAFDLDELGTFDIADNAEIANRLYGVGAGAAQLPTVLRDVASARNAIFLAGGSKQSVAETLREIEKTEVPLREIQNQASEYRQLDQDLNETIGNIKELSEDIRQCETRSQRLKHWATVWSTWTDLQNVQRRLKELPEINDFPDDAISRLERFDERLSEARDALATQSVKHQDAKDEADLPVTDKSLLIWAAEIETIREQSGAFIASVRDLPTRQAEIREEEAKLDEDLKALGPEWTQERIKTIDISIARRDEVSQWQSRLEKCERDEGDRDQETDRLQMELANAEQRVEELKASVRGMTASGKHSRVSIVRVVLPLLLTFIGIGLAFAGGTLTDSTLVLGLGIGMSIAGVLLSAQLFLSTRGSSMQVVRPDEGGLAEARRTVELLRERIVIAEDAQSKAAEQATKMNEQWSGWLREIAIPDSLKPGTARDFLARVETAQPRVNLVRERHGRVKEIQNHIDEQRSLLAPIAEEIGISLTSDNQSFIIASTDIVSRYEDARTAAKNHEIATDLVTDHKSEFDRMEQRLKKVDAERNALLRAGGTEESEEFRRFASQHTERQDSQHREQDLMDSLRRVLGPNIDLADLDSALNDTSLESINSELAEVELKLTDLNDKRDGLLNHRGELTTNLERLQGDEELSRLRARRASLVDQLRIHAEEWSMFSVAGALLDRTRQKYERERQPAVLERASQYFTNLTRGRYERVYKPLDGQGFRVIESGVTQRQKTPGELSRGTREQLYLALRFAAIDEFGKRQERMPVIVDEVLVNFDPERAKRAATAFAQVAERNQVIVFTCHPWVRDTFLEAMPDAGIISLN